MKLLILFSILCVFDLIAADCRRYVGKAVTAIGDWSVSRWNFYDKDALMIFDDDCEYTLVVAGLKPYYSYQWKVNPTSLIIFKKF